jgi:hypothetical protein
MFSDKINRRRHVVGAKPEAITMVNAQQTMDLTSNQVSATNHQRELRFR